MTSKTLVTNNFLLYQ